MPKYNYFCEQCNKEYTFNISIKKYDECEGVFVCDVHKVEMKRLYGEFSVKTARSSKEIVEDIKREKNKILEKAKSGNMSTILDIYGE